MRTALLGTEHACEARAGAKVHGTREGHHGQSRPHSPHCPTCSFHLSAPRLGDSPIPEA